MPAPGQRAADLVVSVKAELADCHSLGAQIHKQHLCRHTRSASGSRVKLGGVQQRHIL